MKQLATSLALLAVLSSTAMAQERPGETPGPADGHEPGTTTPEPNKLPEPTPENHDATGTPVTTEPPKVPVQPQGSPPLPPPPAQGSTENLKATIPSRRATWVDEPPSTTPVAQDDATTSAAWHANPPLGIGWSLLAIPERAVELAFMPIGLLVAATEKHRLDKRFGDLITFYDVFKLSPRFKFSFGDGMGAGLWFKRTDLFDKRAEAKVGFVYRLNGDYQIEGEYEHALLLPGGRKFHAHAYYEKDANQRFYGIGGDTIKANRRVIEVDDEALYLQSDLQGVDRYTWAGIGALGIKRQTLLPGTDATYPSLTDADMDTVGLPPGFHERAIFIDGKVTGQYDTRDTAGRPWTGTLFQTTVHAVVDVTGKNLSAVNISGLARWHIPIISEGRNLMLQASGSATSALFSGDEIPLDAYSMIDRLNMRGYDRNRFRDKYAVLATAEYRFPIYEYLTSRAGLDAFMFFDAGTIWGESKFALNPLRYSYGGGIRGGHETTLVFEATLGFSPDGSQLNLGVEKAL